MEVTRRDVLPSGEARSVRMVLRLLDNLCASHPNGGNYDMTTRHEPIRDFEDSNQFDLRAPFTHGWSLAPTTLRKANDFVASYHRHTGRTARNGGKFAISLIKEGRMGGVAIVGNPLSATLMDGFTAEVLRLCVVEDAPPSACSQLYGACWRAWKAMGGRRMITYTLESENGTSLRAAGWVKVGATKPTAGGWRKGDDNCVRTETAVLALVKHRWEIKVQPAGSELL